MMIIAALGQIATFLAFWGLVYLVAYFLPVFAWACVWLARGVRGEAQR